MVTVLEKVTTRIERTGHPRLSVITLFGVVFLLAGAILWVGSGEGGSTTPLWFQVLVLGYLFVLIGVSGIIAFSVFDRRPDP